jgi:hypothetical protein
LFLFAISVFICYLFSFYRFCSLYLLIFAFMFSLFVIICFVFGSFCFSVV